MEQYLLELIKNNNRVIVPNFGAFIVSRDAGTTVLFNNFLSFNDGLLINHVSSTEGIDTNEATQKVSDFVDHLKEELDKKGEYTIEKLGSFTKDQNGILRFTQDPHLATLLPTDKEAGPEKTESDSDLLDIDSEAPVEKNKELQKKEPQKPVKKPTTPSASSQKPSKADEKKNQTAKKEPVKPPAKRPTPPPPPVNNRKDSAKSNDKPPEKTGGIPTWLIVLIVLIPIILIILYFVWWQDRDKPEKSLPEKTEITDTTSQQPAIDSAAIKKAEEEERLRKEQKEKEKAEQAAKVGKHHLIVGSFKNEKNAQNLVEKLQNIGFENATSFRKDNLIMVSAEAYESLNQARNAQETMLEQHQLENWILTRK